MAFWRFCSCSGSSYSYCGLLSVRLSFVLAYFFFSGNLSLGFSLVFCGCSFLFLDLSKFLYFFTSSFYCSKSSSSDCSVYSILTGDILILFSRTFSGEKPAFDSKNYYDSFAAYLLSLSCFWLGQDILNGAT
jgi:hypothetical protein